MKSTTRCASLLLSLVVLASSVSAADVCSFKKGDIVDVDRAWSCIHTIPFQPNVRDTVMTSLRRAYQLYAFLDIATSPPPREGLFYHQVELMKELEASAHIATQKYQFDFDFHHDLGLLYRRFTDAHTRYIQPHCYKSFVFFQPLELISYVTTPDGGDGKAQEQVVSVDPRRAATSARLQYYREKMDIDLAPYRGARVLAINGERAMTHITQFAYEYVGVSKDLGTRFNIAMRSLDPVVGDFDKEPVGIISGVWSNRNNDWAPFPQFAESHQTVEYKLQLTTGEVVDVQLPWLVELQRNITDTQAFEKLWKAVPEKPLTTGEVVHHPRSQQPEVRNGAMEMADQLTLDAKDDLSSLIASSPRAYRPDRLCFDKKRCYSVLHDSRDVHFYTMSGYDDTVVMYLDTFEPVGVDGAKWFEGNVSLGLSIAATQHRHRLIIDLTENGGGDICLGRRVMGYFLDDHKPWGPSDMPQSKLAQTMVENAVKYNVTMDSWSWDSWTRDDGKPWNGNGAATTVWMDGGNQVKTFGTQPPRHYSQPLHLSDKGCSYDGPMPKRKETISAIKIVTRGLCGSTCAYVANHAAQFDHVETVVVGGLLGQDQQYTSFPGLQVLDTPAMWDSMQSYLQPKKSGLPASHLMPPRIPASVRYRMCIREIYPKFQGTGTPKYHIPTEYTFQPATHHFVNTLESVLDPEVSWFRIAALFNRNE